MTWPPPGPQGPPPGAHLSGWPAFVVDTILKRHAGPYARAMTPEQRAQFETAGRAIHCAALLWQGSISPERNAETVAAEIGPAWVHEVGTAAAAGLLGVTERRVCQLTRLWEAEGLARKVGRAWLLNREAVLLEAQARRSPAA